MGRPPGRERACSGREPLFLLEKKEGGKKTPEGNGMISLLHDYPQPAPGGKEGTASVEVRTHIGGRFPPLTRGFGLALQVTLNFDCRRERAQFTTKLTRYLIGGTPLPLAHKTFAIAETSESARRGYFRGGAGGTLPGPFLPPLSYGKEKKAVPPPGRRVPDIQKSLLPLTEGFGLTLPVVSNFDRRRERALQSTISSPGAS